MADKSVFNPQGDISFNPQNGTFTVGGNLVVTGTTTYQNDTITLNSADTYAINADNDAATGTLRLGNASSNADISYGASGNVVFNKPAEGNFYVGSGQQIIINGGGSIGGGGFTGNLSGTATTAGALVNDRTLTLTGDVTGSVALGLNANTSAPSLTGTLATVNSNVGSFGDGATIPNFTVTGKGLITAAGETTVSITSSQVSNFETAAEALFSVTSNSASGNGALSYSNGVFTFTPASVPTALSQLTGNTDNISEGSTNLYYTDARVRAAVDAVTSGDGSLTYSSATGDFTYTGPSNADYRGAVSGGTGITYSSGTGVFTTDDTHLRTLVSATLGVAGYVEATGVFSLPSTTAHISEGSNLYYTDARARAAISVTDAGGLGSLAYSSGVITYTGPSNSDITGLISVTDAGGDGSLSYSNGAFTYTGPSASEVRAHFSGGTGIDISSGTVAIDSTVVTKADTQTINGDKTFTGTVDLSGATVPAFTVTGNLDVTGTLNSVTQTDLIVENADITMNSGNVAQDSHLKVDRPNPSADVYIKWDETADRWEFTNDGSTDYPLAKNTDDLAEGSTNQYYTDARVDTRVTGTTLPNYTGNMTNLGTVAVSTELLIPNSNSSTDRAIFLSGDQVFVETPGSGIRELTPTSSVGAVERANAGVTYSYGGLQGNGESLLAGQRVVGVDSFNGIKGMVGGTGITLTSNATTLAFALNSTTIDHDVLTNFVANEHIDHSGVTLTAGNGLTGGGDITTSRTFNVVGGTGITVNANNIEVNQSEVRGLLSASSSGDGSLSYSSGTGVFTYAGPGTSDYRAAISVSGDLSYSSGTGVITFSESVNSVNGLTGAVSLSTTNITEGTNLYYTTARANTAIDTRLATKNTDNLAEGSSNLYFTQARARLAISATSPLSYDNSTGVLSLTEVGDISEVVAGSGLTGGATSGSATLNVVGGYGITANANDIELANGEVRALFSASGDLSYDNSTGVFSFTNDAGDIEGVTAGVGLSGGGTSGTVSLALDFSELTDMTSDISGTTEFILQNGTTESRKAANEINISAFSNDAGFTTNVGDITSVEVIAGNGLSGGGSGTSGAFTTTVAFDGDELSSGVSSNADKIVVVGDDAISRKVNANAINISRWNNDAGFTDNIGDITAVVAGTGLTGGATSGSATIDIDNTTVSAGSYGGADAVATFTVNATGQLTAAAATSIAISSSAVSGLASSATTDTTNASNIGSGTLASARLPDLTVADFSGAAIQTGGESFSDSDTVLMTAAAVQDKITSYGYTTNVGDITGVTAGSGLTDGGTSGAVTLNVGAGSYINVNANDIAVDATTTATASKVAARDSSGDLYANLFQGTATSARYADLAEKYEADADYEAGTVLVIGGDKEVTISKEPGSYAVVGVVSTDPAYLMNSGLESDNVVAVALRGRVPCKVTGNVNKGDVLVASDTPGHAMVGAMAHNLSPLQIVGRALESKTDAQPGIIEIIV